MLFSDELKVNEARTSLKKHKDRVGAGLVYYLSQGKEGMHYTIAMDNYFSKPAFFDDLLQRGFYVVGTVRYNQRGFPSILKVPAKAG